MLQREIIHPQTATDQPLIVLLDRGPEGIQREGKFGIDFQYTLNEDSAVMWAKKELRDAIVASGAQAGEEIAIQAIKRGTRTSWQVQRVEEEPNPAAAPPPRTQRQQEAPAHGTRETKANGNGHAPDAAPTREPARPGAAILASALYTAIDAAIAAEEYARAKSFALKFSRDDIRALAISLYIDARKEAR